MFWFLLPIGTLVACNGGPAIGLALVDQLAELHGGPFGCCLQFRALAVGLDAHLGESVDLELLEGAVTAAIR